MYGHRGNSGTQYGSQSGNPVVPAGWSHIPLLLDKYWHLDSFFTALRCGRPEKYVTIYTSLLPGAARQTPAPPHFAKKEQPANNPAVLFPFTYLRITELLHPDTCLQYTSLRYRLSAHQSEPESRRISPRLREPLRRCRMWWLRSTGNPR